MCRLLREGVSRVRHVEGERGGRGGNTGVRRVVVWPRSPVLETRDLAAVDVDVVADHDGCVAAVMLDVYRLLDGGRRTSSCGASEKLVRCRNIVAVRQDIGV